MYPLLHNPASLKDHIQQITGELLFAEQVYPEHMDGIKKASAVLFLLGLTPGDKGQAPEPSLILNKRSQTVTQPGDLCCPGGGISPGLDTFLARAMTLPGLPMWRWPFWGKIRSRRFKEAQILRILFFTSLREGFEEMRLNPFGVRFLGPLPVQRLVMFGRVIYPMIGWVSKQQRFKLNWEVEKIVSIPLRKLLDPGNYVQYRLEMKDPNADNGRQQVYDAPSFLHKNGQETEVLWGATCRITLTFLKLMFGFEVPADGSLPVLKGMLDETYMRNGKRV
ncbi:MAG: CoA pyrophosphatase [Desulfobacterales bacterium]|nr:CoA pyrophosphatase [Desulfobacterales bacterium]MDX2512285.1 CoA pyrophosphatase [Desulfobacterales bacterium]